MPAFDQCHEQVVRALQKEGWNVDAEQVTLALGKRRIFVDLHAVRGVNGSQQQMMLIEVKCFPISTTVNEELYHAIGQYLVYRAMLAERRLETPLYLSIPESIFNAAFDLPVNRVIEDSQIKLVIVNLEAERVVRWIE
jgi:hypothetical protein